MIKKISALFPILFFSSFTNPEYSEVRTNFLISTDSVLSIRTEEKFADEEKVEYKFSRFKSAQMQNARVRNAYEEKFDAIEKELGLHGIRISELEIIILTFKAEQEIEVWAKNRKDETYKLVKTFAFCMLSGKLGPKRKQGDRQVPEGFYRIAEFNPGSNYYLSLLVSYPNQSDRISGRGNNPGGDIYIHGDCVSIGCIPITNDKIKELYVYSVEAINSGQENIPVYMFPEELTDVNFTELKAEYSDNTELLEFWGNLKAGYDKFEYERKELKVSVGSKGEYVFE